MGEIWEGIMAMPKGKKRRDLIDWFNDLRDTLPCLDWTIQTAVVWAELRTDVRKRGYTVPIKDTQIAATAKLHGLIVATRNVTDFTRCGVPAVNPFE